MFTQKIISLMLFTFCILPPIHALENVKELEWDHRVLLIRVIGESEEVLNILEKHDHEIQDRDIYWFVFLEKNIETNYKNDINKNFQTNILKAYFTDTETNVILIGKDGGNKQKSRELDLQDVFDLIDTMPMRQVEMKERN